MTKGSEAATAGIVWKIMPEELESGLVRRSTRGRLGSGVGIVFGAAIGATVATIAALIVASEVAPGLPLAAIVSILAVGALGLLLGFLYGLKLALTRHEISLDATSVTVSCKPLWGSVTVWTESLANYDCVLAKEEIRGSGKSRRLFAFIVLRHSDPARSICLFEQCGPISPNLALGATFLPKNNLRRMWEDYARILGKPAVKEELQCGETGPANVTRDARDLDKSAGELVLEGKVAVAFDPHAVIPAGIELAIDGDATVFTLTPIWKMEMKALVAALVFFLIMLTFCAPVALMALIAVAALYLNSPRTIKLYVTPDRIRITRLNRRGTLEKEVRTFNTLDIEEVQVQSRVLAFVTDEGRLPLLVGLTEEGAQWLRNGLLALLAENAPKKVEVSSE
ncbi:MAG: hypothetical protein RBU21_06445 [FCB group bacterium]|jgi:hypothetical protein|nr:hypothetical protein [FCB group bacterium]